MSKTQYFCIQLTKRQTDYLATIMQNHMDVSESKSVIRDSKNILKKLIDARVQSRRNALDSHGGKW